jgi:hypothetical protein
MERALEKAKDPPRLASAYKESNVVNLMSVEAECKCSLCHCILFEPVGCGGCGSSFCRSCFEKFVREVGSCPMGCEAPDGKRIPDKVINKIRSLIFICPYKANGCDEQIDYDDVPSHIHLCGYKVIHCSSYERCGVRVLKKQIEDHEAICAFKLTKCSFCKQPGISRDDL